MHDIPGRSGPLDLSRIGDFLDWWKRSLAGCLPARWREALGLADDRLLLSRQAGAWSIRMQNQQGLHVLAELPSAPTPEEVDMRAGSALPRWLLLPAAAGLRRRLLLPAAAADRLRDVAGYEIDRQTPFSADTVFHDVRTLGRRGDGQLEVELVVLPREHLDAALKELGDAAAALAGADLAGPDGQPLGVNLLPAGQRRRTADPSTLLNLALAVAALVALALAAGWILENRRTAAETLATDVEARAGQARLAAVQRQRLLDAIEGSAFLERKREERPMAVDVIDELSRRLPDGTYLEKLSIEGDRIMLIGFSPEASALVAKLEGSPLWRSPALAGTVQPDPGSGRDRFTLVAELTGRAAAGASAPTGEGADAATVR